MTFCSTSDKRWQRVASNKGCNMADGYVHHVHHANAKFRKGSEYFARVMWKRRSGAPVKESCSQLTALAEVQLPTTLRAGLSQVRKLWTRRSAFLCRRERICDLGWWIRWAYARKRARPGRQLCPPPHRPPPPQPTSMLTYDGPSP